MESAEEETPSDEAGGDAGEAGAEEAEKKEEPPKPADVEAAGWLAWSDADRDGSGFVEWETFEHPTFGTVEIGGMVPGFTLNPPAAQLDAIAREQLAFLAALLAMQPAVTIEGPEVEAVGHGNLSPSNGDGEFRWNADPNLDGPPQSGDPPDRGPPRSRPRSRILDAERRSIGSRASTAAAAEPRSTGSSGLRMKDPVTIRIDDPLTGVRMIEVPLQHGEDGGDS